MTELLDTNVVNAPKRIGIQALSESSPVRLGLAIAMVAGAAAIVWQVGSIRSELSNRIEEKYVSKELFNVRMDELTRSMAEIKDEMRRLRDGGK